MRNLLPLMLSLSVIPAFAQGGPPKPDNSINVPTGTSAGRDLSKNPIGMRSSAVTPEAWPEGATFVEDKSLPFDNGVPQYDPSENETTYPDGRRVLAIKLTPGEKVLCKLTSTDSKVAMRAFVPSPPPPMKWKLELINANKPLRARRTSRFEVQNTTSDLQILFLILYGEKGNAYRLDLERTPKK